MIGVEQVSDFKTPLNWHPSLKLFACPGRDSAQTPIISTQKCESLSTCFSSEGPSYLDTYQGLAMPSVPARPDLSSTMARSVPEIRLSHEE